MNLISQSFFYNQTSTKQQQTELSMLPPHFPPLFPPLSHNLNLSSKQPRPDTPTRYLQDTQTMNHFQVPGVPTSPPPPPPPPESCTCRLPPSTTDEQTPESFVLSKTTEEELIRHATRILPFITPPSFTHTFERTSWHTGHLLTSPHQIREWPLYTAHLSSTLHPSVSITSQEMNTPSRAYENLVALCRELNEVRVELGVDDARSERGVCVRCGLWERDRRPEEYGRVVGRIDKRFQPGNR